MNTTRSAVPDAYDVIVAGGGTAGVSAACAAAAAGARVLILERAASLGGASTLRNVLGYCGLYTCTPAPRRAVGGVATQVLGLLDGLGGVSGHRAVPGQWVVPILDPEAVKFALDQLAASCGVEVLVGCTVLAATRDGDQIAEVEYVDFGGQRHDVRAGAFVDATGDATLAALGGAVVRIGQNGRMQTATLSARYGGVDPRLQVEDIRAAIRSALHTEGLPLTSSWGFIGRLPISGDLIAYLADEDLNALDAAAYSAATADGRRQAWAYLLVLRGLPGSRHAHLVSTGPELGIRQSRHLDAVTPLRDDVLRTGHIPSDTVALAAWPSEYHPGAGAATRWTDIGGDGAFGITLDNLRSRNTVNLFGAGRVLGGELHAGASVRVLGTAFATGQAAGVAAATFADLPRAEQAARTRTELDRQGACLTL